MRADKNNKRIVFIAPIKYDKRLDLHRAFSFDNGHVTYIHRFAGEKYSTVKDLHTLQSVEQSLVLGDSGKISTAKTITLYKNYHDAINAPFSDVVESDTRFVYYDKGEFEAYIDYLSNQSIDHGIKISGLNVIFGVKNNNASEGIYANHLTLFFAPTSSEDITKSFLCFHSSSNDSQLNLAEDLWYEENYEIKRYSKPTLFNLVHGGPPPNTGD